MKGKFDTRFKKPKVYSIALLTALLAVLFVALARFDEAPRLKWANAALTLYFAFVIALLAEAFVKQLEYNPYSYNTIVYVGFALFCLVMMVMHLSAALECFSAPGAFSERRMLLTLLNSAKAYMVITSPFLLLFAGALFVSNVSLIRHEGRRFVNILGIILSFLLVGGEIVILYLDLFVAAHLSDSLALRLFINLSAAFYLYFECMIIGAIVADSIAALHVPEHDKDFLIILGCGIRKDGTPTPLLKGRVDLAMKFYRDQLAENGKDAMFVVSGGQGPNEVQSEAASMRGYLLTQGIPDDHIIVEDKSTDTAENMRFSNEKIWAVNPDGVIAFFTTNYHVFRAGLKSRRVKMRSQGMGAPTKWYFWPNAAVREFVGLLTEHRGKQGLILFGMLLTYTVLTVIAFR